jgi:uncharacterized protein (DUF2062 family)
MPRRFIKHLALQVHERRHEWYLRIFGDRLTDPHLWSLNRHSITRGFGAGLAIGLIPLPVHTPVIIAAAIWWRFNLPVALAGAYMINPFTMVPIYYAAYRVGALLLHYRPQYFHFRVSWDWLEHGLGPAWKPFLIGCAVFSLVAGLTGRWILEYSWRAVVMRRYRLRRTRTVPQVPADHR